jgi:hypothetical protein
MCVVGVLLVCCLCVVLCVVGVLFVCCWCVVCVLFCVLFAMLFVCAEYAYEGCNCVCVQD